MGWPWKRRNFEQEMVEELRAHVAHRADDLEAAGMARGAAERQARLEFGSVETHKEHIRDERLLGRTFRFLQQTTSDLRFAARRLRYAPLFTIFAVVSIGLGAGVTTAMFSIIRDVFWKSSGIHDARNVVAAANQLELAVSFEPAMSIDDFEDYRTSQTSFESMAAAAKFYQSLAMPAGAQLVNGEAVNDTYFQTLGIRAAAGRVLQPADAVPGAPLVMVLSHQTWRKWFASDPGVVGQDIRFSGTSFQVVGVAAREYAGLYAHPGRVTAAWIPLRALAQLPVYGSPAAPATSRTRRSMMVAGRLKPGVTVSRADAEAATIGGTLDASFPLTATRWTGTSAVRVPGTRQWTLRPIEERSPTPWIRPALIIGIVALVLIVACTNLANLSLARGASREAELAVRMALGASRGRLIRELSAESLLVGAIGYAIAIPLVLSLMRLASVDWFALGSSRGALDPRLDLPVLAACAVAVMLALVVCGLWPAIRLSRTDVRTAVAKAGAIVTPTWRTERQLIGVQTTISVALFCGASALISATAAQSQRDPGIDLSHLTVAQTVFRLQQWDTSRSQQAVEAITATDPGKFGFRSVALSSTVPFGSNTQVYADISATPEGVNTQTAALLMASTPRIFNALGLPIVAGRPFDGRDTANADPVVVITESTALKLFGTRNVVGRDLHMRGAMNAIDDKTIERRTVIGIAKDTDLEALASRRGYLVLVPLAQRYEHPNFVLANRDTPETGDLRGLIREADPDLAVDAVGSGVTLLSGGWTAVRVITGLALALGSMTLALTTAGLFGVLSSLVLRRSREIGIRKAMGADNRAIRRLILGDGSRPVAVGSAVGLCLGALAGFALRASVPAAVQPFPLIALVILALTVVPATLAACYFPARRAMRLDPNVTLKEGH